MSLQIVPLCAAHLEDAAVLVTSRYRAERKHTPSLPPCHEEVNTILPLLRDLAAKAPGVAAIRKGGLVGFLVGQVLDTFRGRRSIYSPEWANAAQPSDGRCTYEKMYAALAARWVSNGCFTHLITILAHEEEVLDALRWLGFGVMAIDAMRDLTTVQATLADVAIRRATVDDIQPAMALSEALQRYMAAAPIFLAFTHKHGTQYHERWLSNPDHALWLAYQGRTAVACLGVEPSNPEAAYVISDEKTISVTRAFTREHVRSRGLATALLQHAIDWARSAGYERCAVDFEPENVLGARFWLAHFQPVCYSLVRDVDQRVAWAHASRADEDLW